VSAPRRTSPPPLLADGGDGDQAPPPQSQGHDLQDGDADWDGLHHDQRDEGRRRLRGLRSGGQGRLRYDGGGRSPRPADFAHVEATFAAFAQRRLEEVISQLSRIGGGQPTGFGPSKILSLPDAIARTLAEHIGQVKVAEAGAMTTPANGKKAIGDLCKECGQATFVYEEGCKKCLSCGFNEC